MASTSVVDEESCVMSLTEVSRITGTWPASLALSSEEKLLGSGMELGGRKHHSFVLSEIQGA